MIHQFCLLLWSILGRMVLLEIRVWNNLETTSWRSKCFCGVLKQRKIEERWFWWFGHGKMGWEQNMKEGERREGSTYRQTSWFWKPCSAASMGCDWLGFSHIQIIDTRSCQVLWYSADLAPEISIGIFNLCKVAKSCCHNVNKLCKLQLSAISPGFDPTFQLFLLA